jgi:hypothetical protein
MMHKPTVEVKIKKNKKIVFKYLRTALFRKPNRVSNRLETEAKKKPAKRTIFG